MAEMIEVSDSDGGSDDANLPSAAECEARCQTFAEITGTDTALAMFYLQDREWIVEVLLFLGFYFYFIIFKILFLFLVFLESDVIFSVLNIFKI